MKGRLLTTILIVLVVLQALAIGLFWREKSVSGPGDGGRNTAMTTEANSLNRACGNRYCNPPFVLLQLQSAQFDRKKVSVAGYLAIHHGSLLLFQTELDYRLGLTHNALKVRAKEAAQKAMFQQHGYSYVWLSGVYKVQTNAARNEDLVGALYSDGSAVGIEEQTSRESWKDIRVDVDDLGK